MADPTLPITSPNPPADDPAVNLIRGKLNELFKTEPSASSEINEIKQVGVASKHQKYLQSLTSSDKDIAEIQTAWHEYYQKLPDQEKHEVWQEFYSNQSRQTHFSASQEATNPENENLTTKPGSKVKTKKLSSGPQSVTDLKKKLVARVSADGRLSRKHHLKSLLFGVGAAGLVALVVVFMLFNQLFITPFISPSKTASATPLIIDPSGQVNVGPETKIIIPKLNIEAPIVMDVTDNEEQTIQAALERGVTLYPNTGKPGELSNPVIFGHSSNNIFNSGNYKFVFVLLSKLENGDTFMINYNTKQYVYRVFNKKVVKPSDVDVLKEKPKDAMVTLITCDPPGSSANRLIVQAEQITPDPSANLASSAPTVSASSEPAILPSNAESLFQRIINWF
ncbi:MAG: class D sortase [Patescibacteria group bacterium]